MRRVRRSSKDWILRDSLRRANSDRKYLNISAFQREHFPVHAVPGTRGRLLEPGASVKKGMGRAFAVFFHALGKVGGVNFLKSLNSGKMNEPFRYDIHGAREFLRVADFLLFKPGDDRAAMTSSRTRAILLPGV